MAIRGKNGGHQVKMNCMAKRAIGWRAGLEMQGMHTRCIEGDVWSSFLAPVRRSRIIVQWSYIQRIKS